MQMQIVRFKNIRADSAKLFRTIHIPVPRALLLPLFSLSSSAVSERSCINCCLYSLSHVPDKSPFAVASCTKHAPNVARNTYFKAAFSHLVDTISTLEDSHFLDTC